MTEAETYFVLCVRKSARGSVGILPDVMHCGKKKVFFSQHIVRRGFTATQSEAPNVLRRRRTVLSTSPAVMSKYTQKNALKSKFLFSPKEANVNIWSLDQWDSGATLEMNFKTVYLNPCRTNSPALQTLLHFVALIGYFVAQTRGKNLSRALLVIGREGVWEGALCLNTTG